MHQSVLRQHYKLFPLQKKHNASNHPIDYFSQKEIEHSLPVVNIFTKTESKIIAEKTNNNAIVIDEKWEIDRGVLGNINQTINNGGILGIGMAILGAPVALAAAASWTYATIIYKIEVDLYHLTKERKNIFIAQMSKMLKNKREKIIIDTMRTQIKDGFEDAIESSVGILSPMVVTVKSVDIY